MFKNYSFGRWTVFVRQGISFIGKFAVIDPLVNEPFSTHWFRFMARRAAMRVAQKEPGRLVWVVAQNGNLITDKVGVDVKS